MRGSGAERDTQCDVPRALRDCGRHHAIQSNCRQDERQPAEHGQHRQGDPLRCRRALDLFAHRDDFRRRDVRIEGVHFAHESGANDTGAEPSPDVQSENGRRMLPQGHVEIGFRRVPHVARLDRPGQADDPEPLSLYL